MKSELLVIFVPFFDNGGVERMLVNLACGMSRLGVRIRFIVGNAKRPYLGKLERCGVELLDFQTKKPSELADRLEAFVREQRPDVLLSAKEESDEIAYRVKRKVAGELGTRFFSRAVVNISERLKWRNPLKRLETVLRMRRVYPALDGIIAVSEGVAEDMARLARVERARIAVAPNPVITPELAELGEEAPDHPWFAEELPVIVGVGRLGRQKNFKLLVRAFARVRRRLACRLVILGEGRQRRGLERLVARLGIERDVALPGFAENPYPYVKNAALFVLASRWEGSPNALTEAMAYGTPVVAVDCPSGPRELLQGGRIGELLPNDNDPDRLAEAMVRSLTSEHDPRTFMTAVEAYTVENSARKYGQALGLVQ